ncbi:hypothetical protein M1L60_24865 [Actinoplanes sp. TRM 88003]|uniref:DNA mismatch repair proteins mutS family domain-containing protein n=1 Tax=Paractinoplanes aksuensis TaxID=2939490 RepID=A0ABT1DSL6_9ACTN|nr:hypothetical protein [Actinoplanes aksuensis]MCO8273833.1 hypothetical protein [Actinoplanes aksuensis]
MRPGLLFAEPPAPAPHAEQVAADLGLPAVIDAMADGEELIAETARAVLLSVPPSPEQVARRQGVLTDFLNEPDFARELYDVAERAHQAERDAGRTVFVDTPEALLKKSVTALTAFVQLLRELRRVTERYRPRVSSAGVTQFCTLVGEQFDEAYLESATACLDRLVVRGDLLVSARLGAAFVMREPHRQARSLFRRGGRTNQPSATYKVPAGDEGGHRALGSLRDQALAGLAEDTILAARQVLAFFTALRAESAFYRGCLNLRRALRERGATVVLPVVREGTSGEFNARGLYDPGLQLRLDHPAAANDLDAGSATLIMVTGANRGGKSTFLRSLGLAQLMAAAGMFVAATTFTAPARSGVFTHFAQDEDTTRTSGKFDEELRRMSRIADAVAPHALLLLNESFQSTNEREGSDIARHILDAMTGAGVTVVFVTHLHALADGCFADRDRFPAVFLRADRDRSFQLREAPPEASSHGADLWKQRIR